MKLAPGVKIAMGSRTYKGAIPDDKLKESGFKEDSVKKMKKTESPKQDKK